MTLWLIRRLNSAHDRTSFDCGEPTLNEWLHHRAGQYERRDLARTFIATRSDESLVRGYYTMLTHRVVYDMLPTQEAKGLPKLDVPVVLIGRLAVDRSVQGQGLGAHLLVDALRRTVQISEQVGIRAVEVEALNKTAQRFYLKFGFRPLLDDPLHLWLPLHEIRKLKLDPLE